MLDEACSQARVFSIEDDSQEQDDLDEIGTSPVITAPMIADVISARTGIPVRAPGREERDRLLTLETRLKARVIGQDEAVKRVSQSAYPVQSRFGRSPGTTVVRAQEIYLVGSGAEEMGRVRCTRLSSQ